MRLAAAVAGDIDLTRTRLLDELVSVTSSEVDIVAHIWRGDSDPAELDVEFTDSETGEIEIDFGDEYGWLATEAAAGVWLLEYVCTFGDGAVLTLPATWPDEIAVRDDHDPVVP